MELPY